MDTKTNQLRPSTNLRPQRFPSDLDWSPTKRFDSLDQLFNFVNMECEDAIHWYYEKKKSKAILGYWLRLGAIVAVAAAGLIPIIGILCSKDRVPCLSPAWATVSLAIAALLISLDRFGGYTSGWVRYVRTAQIMTSLQGDFLHDWQVHRHDRQAQTSEETNIKITQDGISMCKKFLQSVNTLVQSETSVWAQEFQQALMEVDRGSKSRSDESNNG
ncbi:MAG: DUF4231 domain-containing protein [Stenomitos rutilans HA7619-LM2]|nr:DUF4231 domain-containing protein [Stenomitos rutilans HA7619-LM2]